MSKVNWINHKTVHREDIFKLLDKSIEVDHLTNYGPLVRSLEEFLRVELEVDEDRAIIVTCNGALALHSLVSGINLHCQRDLRYATQAYTFPSASQGPLRGSQIVDIDENLHLDLDQVENCDGIIVTQLFGNICDISKYLAWSEANNKVLIFDNATVPLGQYEGSSVLNYGDGCFVSLHHTKPIGFGEGGFIVAKKKYEDSIRRCINFGFQLRQGQLRWDSHGNNAKMSDISAAFILGYLQNGQIQRIREHHQSLYRYFVEKLVDTEIKMFPSLGAPTVSCFALIMPMKIVDAQLYHLSLNNVVARKYYLPLEPLVRSQELYDHILCLPCHLDLTTRDIDRYIAILKTL